MAFNEEKLEQAIVDLLGEQGYPHLTGAAFAREPQEVLISADLEAYLRKRYAAEGIADGEIRAIVRKLQNYSSADLYDSNKATMKLMSDGFLPKRVEEGSYGWANRTKSIDLSKQQQNLVEKHNARHDANLYRGKVAGDFTDNIIDGYVAATGKLNTEIGSYADLEEKAFYDTLNSLMKKYELEADLTVLSDEFGDPPINRDEVYKGIFEQAENFKSHPNTTRAL